MASTLFGPLPHPRVESSESGDRTGQKSQVQGGEAAPWLKLLFWLSLV
jgi:hypothetical protein